MMLHPIVVHFPIALLTLYSGLELLRWRRCAELPFWTPLKGFLVIVGSGSSFLALATGKLLEDQFRNDPILYRVVEAHSFWANITTWVYALLALAYLLVLADRLGWIGVVEQSWSNAARLSSVLRRAAAWADTLTQSLGGALVALVGLIALTITGALGGSLIYGPAVDPIVELVYRLYGF